MLMNISATGLRLYWIEILYPGLQALFLAGTTTEKGQAEMVMSMSHELDRANSLIAVRINRPLPVEEQQEILAKIVSEAAGKSVSKWLFILNTTETQDTNEARRFTEFVLDHLKLYISKLAVVCDATMRSRVREVVEPIENQEKPVGIFSSEVEARAWLQE